MSTEPQGSEAEPHRAPPKGAIAAPNPELVREETRRAVQHMVGFQLTTGPAPNAFIEKLQPAHIDKILDGADSDSKREHFRLLTFGIGGALGFLVLCYLFLHFQQQAMLDKILTLFVGFIGGFGFGRFTKKS